MLGSNASHEGIICLVWQGELGKSRAQSSPGPGEKKQQQSEESLEAALWMRSMGREGLGGERQTGRGGRAEVRGRGIGWSLPGWPSQGRIGGPHGADWPAF